MKRIITLITLALMLALTAIPVHAEYHAELGDYISDIEIGGEYVFESVRFPGKVMAPDTRPDYTDWMTLVKFYPQSPRGARQMWFISNYDEHTGERDGYIQISNHAASYGSGTLRLVTYTPDGYFWQKDKYGDASQWFTAKKAYKDKSGRQVWRFVNEASGCRLCAGGWSDFYLREVVEIDPAQVP